MRSPRQSTERDREREKKSGQNVHVYSGQNYHPCSELKLYVLHNMPQRRAGTQKRQKRNMHGSQLSTRAVGQLYKSLSERLAAHSISMVFQCGKAQFALELTVCWSLYQHTVQHDCLSGKNPQPGRPQSTRVQTQSPVYVQGEMEMFLSSSLPTIHVTLIITK